MTKVGTLNPATHAPQPARHTHPSIHTFHLPRYDLDAVLGKMERVVVGHLGPEHSDNLVPVLLGQQPHPSRAEDVKGGVLMARCWDVLQRKLQQRLQGREGCGWAAAKGCHT